MFRFAFILIVGCFSLGCTLQLKEAEDEPDRAGDNSLGTVILSPSLSSPSGFGRCAGDAGALDHLIGEVLTDVIAQFPSGADEFQAREPGKIYTMQFIAGRTLAYLDSEGIITSIGCG